MTVTPVNTVVVDEAAIVEVYGHEGIEALLVQPLITVKNSLNSLAFQS